MLCCPKFTSGCGSEKSETNEKLFLRWRGFFCFEAILLKRYLFDLIKGVKRVPFFIASCLSTDCTRFIEICSGLRRTLQFVIN